MHKQVDVLRKCVERSENTLLSTDASLEASAIAQRNLEGDRKKLDKLEHDLHAAKAALTPHGYSQVRNLLKNDYINK